jgi:hypothetical protein
VMRDGRVSGADGLWRVIRLDFRSLWLEAPLPPQKGITMSELRSRMIQDMQLAGLPGSQPKAGATAGAVCGKTIADESAAEARAPTEAPAPRVWADRHPSAHRVLLARDEARDP